MALNTAYDLDHLSGFDCIDSCDMLLQHEIDKFAAQFVSQVGLCAFLFLNGKKQFSEFFSALTDILFMSRWQMKDSFYLVIR